MKTVIEMAREIFDVVADSRGRETFSGDSFGIERFAKLVRADAIAAERELCATVCDVLAVHPEYASEVTKLAAMAIRARRNT